MQTQLESTFLNRDEAICYIGVSRTTFHKLVKLHSIPVCRLTRRPKYRRTDLDRLMQSAMTTDQAMKIKAVS